MINELVGGIVCLIAFKYTESKWLPDTKPTTVQPPEVYVPEIWRTKQIENMIVPSKTFCTNMYLRTFGQEIILPWWHDLCEGMRERKEKKRSDYFNKYGWVLDTLNLYKRSGGPVPERVNSPLLRNKKL